MKILISAYDCRSDRGSEPGKGWAWAVEVARRGHEVWLLTRQENRRSVEAGLDAAPAGTRIRPVYAEVSERLMAAGGLLRSIYPGHSLQHNYVHYTLWQHAAYPVVEALHARVGFDLIQQVSVGSVRVPSLLGRVGPPFVFGPVAGGERAPWPLRRGYRLSGHLLDILRDLSGSVARFDPRLRRTLREAKRIVVTSEQTRDLLPPSARAKTSVQLAIGIEPHLVEADGSAAGRALPEHGCRVLFAGRLVHHKGMHLGLPAFALAVRRHPNMTLSVFGTGPERGHWEELARRLGIAERVEWHGRVPRTELMRQYLNHDLLLFPSLRESGGWVPLEALACGLPVVCLDLGGPAVLVDSSCGRVIPTGGKRCGAVIAALGDTLVELGSDPALHARLRAGALRQASRFTWPKTVAALYQTLEREPGPQ